MTSLYELPCKKLLKQRCLRRSLRRRQKHLPHRQPPGSQPGTSTCASPPTAPVPVGPPTTTTTQTPAPTIAPTLTPTLTSTSEPTTATPPKRNKTRSEKNIPAEEHSPRKRHCFVQLFSQNCNGLKTTSRITELIDTSRRRNAHITCLQETWREGTEELEEDGFIFVGVAPDKQLSRRGSQGVGILLSPKAVIGWRAAGSFSITNLGPRVIAVSVIRI